MTEHRQPMQATRAEHAVFLDLAGAEKAAGIRLRVGVCERYCSPWADQRPTAWAWPSLSSTRLVRYCPECRGRLRVVSRYRWAGEVRLMPSLRTLLEEARDESR